MNCKKFIKIIVIFMIAITIIFFIYKHYNNKYIGMEIENIDNPEKWVVKLPMANTFTRKTERDYLKLNEARKKELLGTITNKYGIRDDILAYILSAIPADNKKAIEAAIHDAQNEMEIFYNDDPDSARHAASIGFGIGVCMDFFLGMILSNRISMHIDDLYRNTSARAEHLNDIEVNVLSGHVYNDKSELGKIADEKDREKFCKEGGEYWK